MCRWKGFFWIIVLEITVHDWVDPLLLASFWDVGQHIMVGGHGLATKMFTYGREVKKNKRKGMDSHYPLREYVPSDLKPPTRLQPLKIPLPLKSAKFGVKPNTLGLLGEHLPNHSMSQYS
jgi:hypothetical protein